MTYYIIGSTQTPGARYRYVEVEDESGIHRFTTSLAATESLAQWRGGTRLPIDKNLVGRFKARYAIEWEDVSTTEDRDHWIAGGALRITDRLTGELLGERIGYLLDTGMGSTDGYRSPWSWARAYSAACPGISDHNRVFVEKVLKPAKDE